MSNGTRSGGNSAGKIPPGLPRDLPGIDIDGALARLSNREDLYTEFARMFLDEYGDFLTRTQTLLDQDKYGTLAGMVHSMKGAAGVLGAQDLHQAATELEKVLRAEVSPRPVREYYRAFQEEMTRVLSTARGLVADLNKEQEEDSATPGEGGIRNRDSLAATMRDLDQQLGSGSFSARNTIKSMVASEPYLRTLEEFNQLERHVAAFKMEEARTTLARIAEKTGVDLP